MTTRSYYIPRNRIGRQVMNSIVERIGCSIGEIKPIADAIRFSITCEDRDVPVIEKILKRYDMLESIP